MANGTIVAEISRQGSKIDGGLRRRRLMFRPENLGETVKTRPRVVAILSTLPCPNTSWRNEPYLTSHRFYFVAEDLLVRIPVGSHLAYSHYSSPSATNSSPFQTDWR